MGNLFSNDKLNNVENMERVRFIFNNNHFNFDNPGLMDHIKLYLKKEYLFCSEFIFIGTCREIRNFSPIGTRLVSSPVLKKCLGSIDDVYIYFKKKIETIS